MESMVFLYYLMLFEAFDEIIKSKLKNKVCAI